MSARETISKKTLLVERDRTHYARSYGDSERVRVDEPLTVDLELPTSYARDLLAAFRRLLAEGSEFERVQLSIDVPVRLHLRPTQIEQLIEQLAKIAEASQR